MQWCTKGRKGVRIDVKGNDVHFERNGGWVGHTTTPLVGSKDTRLRSLPLCMGNVEKHEDH